MPLTRIVETFSRVGADGCVVMRASFSSSRIWFRSRRKSKEEKNESLMSHVPKVGVPRYRYCKNHKETVKTGQTRTREWIDAQEPELMIGSKEGTGSFGASNRLEDLESSFSPINPGPPSLTRDHLGVVGPHGSGGSRKDGDGDTSFQWSQFTTPCSHLMLLIKDIMINERPTTQLPQL
ncbi:hypothetical protein Tco_0044675 [Tanacetum coccineum]